MSNDSNVKNKETFGKTVGFVFVVCLVCALLVSFSAVQLKPQQAKNKLLDQQTKILEASGLLEKAGKDIVPTFEKYVEAKMIDLDSGDFIEGDTTTFEERRAARSDNSIKPKDDMAGINLPAPKTGIFFMQEWEGKRTKKIFSPSFL